MRPSTAVTRTVVRPPGRPHVQREASGRAAAPRPRRRGRRGTMIVLVPSGAGPVTSPKETSRGAGATIAAAPGVEEHRRGVEHDGIMAILAHLDLDAFFAAVEELEQPELRAQAARRRRRPARARRRLDRELRRTALRHPLGDELRRGAAALPDRGLRAAAPRALPGVLAGGLGGRARGRPDGSSGPGSTRATSTSAALAADSRARARVADAVQTSVRAATSLSCSLGVAPTQGRRQGRVRPAQAGRDHGRPGRDARRASSPRSRCARSRASGPRAEERLAAAGVTTVGELAASTTSSCARCSPARWADAPRPRARDRPARARGQRRADLDLGRGDVRARPPRPRHAPRRAAADGGAGSATTSAATGSRRGR